MILTKTNREHSFDVELAEIHGIQKRRFCSKNFDYWVRENERKAGGSVFMGGRILDGRKYIILGKKVPVYEKDLNTAMGR
jgi:hypothetical protein